MVTPVTLVHLSDLHFGGPADLDQLEALEAFVPALEPGAVAISGDFTQRARHGEFQAARGFVRALGRTAPVLAVPGNHDVEWWQSPFGVRGRQAVFRKYRRYFGEELTPVVRVPGAVLAGALSSHGVAAGSLTPRIRDLAVIGHLPKGETDRVSRVFAGAGAEDLRVVVVHHNVLRGELSARDGLANRARAQERLVAAGADLVLCGHDHQERVGQLAERTVVCTAGTHSHRSRGGRPSVFNLIRAGDEAIRVEQYRWDRAAGRFEPSDTYAFARRYPYAVAASQTS